MFEIFYEILKIHFKPNLIINKSELKIVKQLLKEAFESCCSYIQAPGSNMIQFKHGCIWKWF